VILFHGGKLETTTWPETKEQIDRAHRSKACWGIQISEKKSAVESGRWGEGVDTRGAESIYQAGADLSF